MIRRSTKMKEVKANVKLPEGTCYAYDCKACGWSDPGEKVNSVFKRMDMR